MSARTTLPPTPPKPASSGSFDAASKAHWTSPGRAGTLPDRVRRRADLSVKSLVQSRWSPLVAVASALLLLAAAIALTQAELRNELRGQLARRDGNLFALLLRQQVGPEGTGGLVDPLADLLETASLPELPGLRTLSLYDSGGRFTAALPATAEETALTPESLALARTGGVFSRLDLHASLAAETILPENGNAPLLEVVLPISDPLGGDRNGFARLVLDGSGLAQEFAELDASLRRQAWLAFIIAGSAMAVALTLAFRQIQATNRRLRLANAELTLAAKTAAIGAVTSHLIHGLKNPLAGLQHFVAGKPAAEAADWMDAAETTRRMRTMIDGVMQVLRHNAFSAELEVPLPDLLESVRQRVEPLAAARGVTFRTNADTDAELMLAGRQANLAGLILENLATNAVQASAAGGVVQLSAQSGDEGPMFHVSDRAGGLPDHVRSHLFTPVQSAKPGGSGIGLALSRQIAASIGARLELVSTGPAGTEFSLQLPPTDRRD